MKSEIAGIIFLIFFSIIGNSYAIENEYELKYNLLPKKIHEDDIILLEVYKTVRDQISLEKIQELKIESLDKTIIEIIGLEDTHDYKTLVKLKAKSEGETTLYLFSEKSQSLEIPITVYGNNLPKDISLNIFPDTFEINKNEQGILSILLTDENGIVTRANKDYLIKLSISKPGIVSLESTSLIISKGDFDVKQTFQVIKEGIVTITAKTGDYESTEVLVVEKSTTKTIEISIIPEEISSFKTSNGYIIAQLFSGGTLTKAVVDSTVFYKISNNSTSVNTSSEISALNPSGYFQIKKGQTYGYESFSIQKRENVMNYTATITSQNPLTVIEKSFETIDVELFGDEQVKFEPLSVLADGNKQLIGVIYLEDENGHPVIANRDIVVPFTTSDTSISIENAIIKNGSGSGLVYGNVGYFIPDDPNIAPKTQYSELVELDIHGFDVNSISLKTYASTDHFLKGEQHWIIVYMESSEGLFKIPDDQLIESSESEIFQIDKDGIETYSYFTLIPITAIDSGEEDLVFSTEKFETVISLSSISSKPDSLNLNHSDKLFSDIKDSFLIQILNSQGMPIEVNENVEVKIFSSNPTILDFPKNVIITPKTSFVTLDIIPKMSGTIEISLVSEGLPILTEEITVDEATPTLQITSEDVINEGDSFIVSILAKQNGIPLQNVDITWELEGGITTIADGKTGPTGEAVASIIAISNNTIKISASIDNGPIQSAFASKIVKVNATAEEIFEESISQNSFTKPDMGGFDPVIIIVPALVGGIILYMKKKKSK